MNVGILNFWWNSNKGAILTCYALYKLCQSLNLNPKVIKYMPYFYYHKLFNNSDADKFSKKYFNLTNICYNTWDLKHLNNEMDAFFVGSDQVWRHSFNKDFEDIYYLNFVDLDKLKMSIAASFGIPNFEGDYNVVNRVKYYLSRFNFISVREEEAVKIINETFNQKAKCILDPVFLVDTRTFDEVADSVEIHAKDKYIAVYLLNNTDICEKASFKDYNELLEKRFGLPVININDPYISVEQWLAYIKNAHLVISNSYHCTCFSLIYHKNFITLYDKAMDNNLRDTRLSFMDLLGIKNKLIGYEDIFKNLQEIYDDIAGIVYENINHMANASLNWLKTSISEYSENKNNFKINDRAIFESFYSLIDDRLHLNKFDSDKINERQDKILDNLSEKLAKQDEEIRVLKNLLIPTKN